MAHEHTLSVGVYSNKMLEGTHSLAGQLDRKDEEGQNASTHFVYPDTAPPLQNEVQVPSSTPDS